MIPWKLLVFRKRDLLNPTMRQRRSTAAALIGALLLVPQALRAEEFPDALKRVDAALRTNPSKVTQAALDSCLSRRNFAAKLYESQQTERAFETLKFCFEALEIPETIETTTKKTTPSLGETQTKATAEVEKALLLTPNVANGLEIYRDCASCHKPEGWGLASGTVPQIAGQHHKVVIKQLADIRAGNRVNPLMLPHASAQAIGGPQAVADVAGYVDSLKMSIDNGKGSGRNLELGKQVYQANCARCHGAQGEGDGEKFVPRIQSQHYKYMLRQFRAIRDGKRRNADPEMAEQIQNLKDKEVEAVLDYASRLEPPKDLQAPPGWKNPDFAKGASK